MSKFTVADLARSVSARHGISQESAEAFVTEFFNVINSGIHEEKAAKVRGLGTFKVIDVRERESVNVNTGERVTIEGHGKINFTPDSIMRDLVNKPFAKFETVVLNEGVDLDELNSVGGTELTDDTDEDLDYETDNVTEPVEIVTENTVAEASVPAQKAEDEAVEAHRQQQSEPEHPVEDTSEDTVTGPVAEPAIQSEPAPVEQLEFPAVETPAVDSADEDEDNDHGHRRHAFYMLSASFLFAVIAFVGGYLLGQHMASRPVFKTVKIYNIQKKKPVADTITAADTAKTSVSGAREKSDKAGKEVPKAPEKTVTAEQKPKTETAEPAAPSSAGLVSARRIVKTGAYVITGTSQTITVRKGQTMHKLAKFYLGEGMECYIQVHNGVEEVSEGMSIKIPSLKLKKR